MKKHQLTDLLNGNIELEIGGDIRQIPINGIEIPIIQRDYAQGRPDEIGVLSRFLDALFNALKNDQELELDFIYGSIKGGLEKNTSGLFLPLDGQQRLTTLYLLHWFLCNTELSTDEQVPVREKLARFKYATRATASSFCEKLAEITFIGNPADNMRHAYWFHKIFEMDPTVTAMLNTLEVIHSKYQRQPFRLHDRLHRLCFYILPLDGFSLTDELYIKMNARGKPLTDFENLKADLINQLKDSEHQDHDYFFATKRYGDTEMPYYLTIASKIDNSWTDIFWPTACSKGKDEEKIVDPYFLRFINRYTLNLYITQSNRPVAEIEKSEIFSQLYGMQGIDTSLRYRQFDSYRQLSSAKGIADMERLFDNLIKYQDEIRNLIKPCWETTYSWFLYDAEISQVQRILFLAATLYLEKNEFIPDQFREWIRVAWNIMIDPDIRSIPAMITAMQTIKWLSAGSANIYKFLQSDTFQTLVIKANNIHGSQLQEERQKAALLELPEWAENIYRAEAHPLFRGNIGFLLESEPNADVFALRISNALHIFSKTGPDKAFNAEFGLLRYVISSFTNWDQLLQFTVSNEYANWQLNLRRNTTCKTAVSTLCNLTDIATIQLRINAALVLPSQLGHNDNRMVKVHESLYQHAGFIHWTQSKGVTRLKWLHDHIYLIRPSAWYDKVMLDCYRNELIEQVSEVAAIPIITRCGQSPFFWGEEIEVSINRNNIRYKLLFDRANQTLIKTQQETDGVITWQTKKIFDASTIMDMVSVKSMAEQINNFINTVQDIQHGQDSEAYS